MPPGGPKYGSNLSTVTAIQYKQIVYILSNLLRVKNNNSHLSYKECIKFISSFRKSRTETL